MKHVALDSGVGDVALDSLFILAAKQSRRRRGNIQKVCYSDET